MASSEASCWPARAPGPAGRPAGGPAAIRPPVGTPIALLGGARRGPVGSWARSDPPVRLCDVDGGRRAPCAPACRPHAAGRNPRAAARRRGGSPLAATASAAPVGARAATVTLVPACRDVNLRTGASTTSSVKARLSSGTLTATGSVKGSAWRTDCGGPVAGSTWSRISHVNGKPVSSLYGVPVLYVASGVLKAAPARAAHAQAHACDAPPDATGDDDAGDLRRRTGPRADAPHQPRSRRAGQARPRHRRRPRRDRPRRALHLPHEAVAGRARAGGGPRRPVVLRPRRQGLQRGGDDGPLPGARHRAERLRLRAGAQRDPALERDRDRVVRRDAVRARLRHRRPQLQGFDDVDAPDGRGRAAQLHELGGAPGLGAGRLPAVRVRHGHRARDDADLLRLPVRGRGIDLLRADARRPRPRPRPRRLQHRR